MILESLVSITLLFAGAADFKCPRTHSMPGMPEEQPVVLIDGVVTTSWSTEVTEAIGPESIDGIAIKCWNPDTGALPAREGIQLILITTKELVQTQRSAVEDAVAAVLAFEEAHGRAPEGLDEVEPGVDYRVTEGGWTVANGGGPLAYRCSAEKAVAAAPVVECDMSYELAKENLRERYERGGDGGGT